MRLALSAFRTNLSVHCTDQLPWQSSHSVCCSTDAKFDCQICFIVYGAPCWKILYLHGICTLSYLKYSTAANDSCIMGKSVSNRLLADISPFWWWSGLQYCVPQKWIVQWQRFLSVTLSNLCRVSKSKRKGRFPWLSISITSLTVKFVWMYPFLIYPGTIRANDIIQYAGSYQEGLHYSLNIRNVTSWKVNSKKKKSYILKSVTWIMVLMTYDLLSASCFAQSQCTVCGIAHTEYYIHYIVTRFWNPCLDPKIHRFTNMHIVHDKTMPKPRTLQFTS